MNLEDLWIGDKVKILSLNLVGTFQGIINEKAKVKYGTIKKLFAPNEIELYDDISNENYVELNINKTENVDIIKEKLNFKNSIDLHIEKLNCNMIHKTNAEILRYQLDKFEDYLTKAIELRIGKVTIIHGIGTGILKKEVRLILETNPKVSIIYETNNGGALEVWLK